MDLAVLDGALVVPALEDRADRAPELLHGILRERLAVLDQDFVRLADHLREAVGRDFGVGLHVLALAGALDRALELMLRHAEHHVAVHREQAAVAVAQEARVHAAADLGLDDRVVQAQIEDGVHHARHGGRRARAHRHQQRAGRVAEAAAEELLDLPQLLLELFLQAGGIGLAVRVVVLADVRRDRETGRHRNAQAGHFRQAGALAAEQLLLIAAAFRAAAAERVNVLLRHPNPLFMGTAVVGLLPSPGVSETAGGRVKCVRRAAKGSQPDLQGILQPELRAETLSIRHPAVTKYPLAGLFSTEDPEPHPAASVAPV